MKLFGRNVLLVGHNFHAASTFTSRLNRWKFLCHFANTMEAASELLMSQPVDLVLSNAYLSDGTGFGLLKTLARVPFPVSGFLCLPVEKSCLWLPAIDGGKPCLGLPTLRPREFVRTLEEMAGRLPVEPRDM